MLNLNLLERTDLNKIVEWNINKGSDFLLQWSGIYNYPLTLEQIENYLDNINKENSNINIYKIHINTGEIIGTIELREIDKNNKIGRVSRFLIGDEKYRGRGIGREVLKEIIRIGFKDLSFNKITLGVFDSNHAAIKCYEHVGFKKVAFLKNARKLSYGYCSIYEMAISKKEWQIIYKI